jgi:hypothetical protein
MTSIAAMRLTVGSRLEIRTLGLHQAEALKIVQALTEADFHHCMACIRDPTNFQDVYRPTFGDKRLYVKFQEDRKVQPAAASPRVTGAAKLVYFLVSFKEWI